MTDETRELLDEGDLLDEKGRLVQSGYAFSQVKTYDRAAIKHKRLRIKEWDYYCFCDDKRAIALTVADNSYMSLGSVSVMDFERLSFVTKSKIGLLPKGKLNMPKACADGNVLFDKGGVKIAFENKGGARRLTAEYRKFDGKKDFSCDIELAPYDGDNITTATPFDKSRQFYYNIKINCLEAKGAFCVGEERYQFAGYGGLDWGRGVWPYKNVWYWSSLSTEVDGVPFGLNLGYGFGKPLGTENTVFYGGKAHKIGRVAFEIPFTLGEIDYLKPWKISDDDGRLQIMFYPMIDRKDRMNVGVLSTDQHQVFGKFYGKATLDDGKIVTFADKIGFAEHVRNKW